MMVFFDIDDTLMDDRRATRAGVSALHRLAGVSGTVDELVARWSASLDLHFARYLAGELSYQAQRRARIRDVIDSRLTDQESDRTYETYLEAYEPAWTLFPDVLPCIDALEGTRLGIISNGQPAHQRRKLERTDLTDRVDYILISDECAWSKPSRGIFLHACESAGVAPADAVYIGDRYDVDAVGARNAGLTGIWLDRRRARREAHENPILTGLDELPDALLGR
jgi:putative hydrolase of the HAD superfamily